MSLPLQLLTTAELATHLKRAPETLARWRRLRQGPPFRQIYGRVLYDMGEVTQWLKATSHQIAFSEPGDAP